VKTVVNVEQGPVMLYRLFDAEDTLIYVGISLDEYARFAQHRRAARWWGEVDHYTAEPFPTRKQARQAELATIREERPRYNIAGNVQGQHVAGRRKRRRKHDDDLLHAPPSTFASEQDGPCRARKFLGESDGIIICARHGWHCPG
jgi:predicted GIY-YIG superfamily endonuclease